MSLFKVENISYTYDKLEKDHKEALSNVSFDIEKGDFVAIVGRTGSGKSTLVSILNGLLKADNGDIYYDGKSIYDKDYDLSKLRFNCGVVFQYPEYQLFSETVLEDVCFGALKKGLSMDAAKENAYKIMKKLGIYELKDESPFVLSGGEKRKAAFAGVLVTEPSVLILDEPEAGLDTESKNELFNFITMLNKEKKITIIFITHNLDDAVEYANKVIVLNNGKLLGLGTPYDVFSDKKIMDETNLIKPFGVQFADRLKKKNIAVDTTKISFDDIVEYMTKI